MIVLRNFDRGCMRFLAFEQDQKLRTIVGDQRPKIKIYESRASTISAKRRIAELLFESCSDCARMAAIPQGAFAVCKVRRNLERDAMITAMERENAGKENVFNMRPPLEGWELTPLKYNSKLMNSIWGLYNRYSVHNFKKNTDSNEGVLGSLVAAWGTITQSQTPAAISATAIAAAKNNS
ncbi:uncharacterized protein LOC143426236 [Xylocopa sonorina]|uniref:uncharacterized protein LOC143426236 n=1 Tax=Xylocopa sonorina TaxID=1818115 RepID=UPI00403AE6BF